MANCYVKFSEQIDLSGENESDWVRRQLDSGDLENEREWECPEDEGNGFEWEVFEESAGEWRLWLYAEESGNPLAVAQFVQAFLKRFRPEESFWVN